MTIVSNRHSVVVIGAGQAGLAVAHYLQKLGLHPGADMVVLDRGPSTGGAWQHRWEALRVGSAHRINDLPAMADLDLSFETVDRSLPAKEVVADFYRQYERHFGLEVVRPAIVTSVFGAGADLFVRYTDGGQTLHLQTDVVVNATGTWGAPFRPWYPGATEFLGRHVHTVDFVDAAEFRDQSVVVVGGGTSAVGFLLELEHQASALTWVARRAIEFSDEGDFDLETKASAVATQDDAARSGRALPSRVSSTGIPRTRRIVAGIERGLLVAKPMFTRIEPEGLTFADGSFQPVDAIVWATGFRPELRHLAPLKLREREGGIQVGGGAAWKDPRIFFAGYGPQASTIGANRSGRAIARQVIATLSNL